MFFRAIGINVPRAMRRFNSTSPSLTWTDFLRLKKQNHVINTAASSVTALTGAAATFTYLGNYEFDPEKTIMGIDPIFVLMGAVMAGGFAGYLVGPTFGTRIFNLKNQRVLSAFRAKDLLFLQKIKQNRVNPSLQSFSNPVPDYYGEKIYLLKDYKQWLRDCNAFRRKTKEFL